jgi:hypothetical protein
MHIFNINSADSIADISKLMIMIETGKRLYENGIRICDPGPLNVYDTGYCKISMQYDICDIFIITPRDMTIAQCVLSFVNSIEVEMQKIQSPVSKMIRATSMFSNIEIPVKYASSSIESSEEAFVTRRVFKFNTNTTRRSLFTWNILHKFPSLNDGVKNDKQWMMHQNGIIVDFTNVVKSYRQITSTCTLDILKDIGIINDDVNIIYFAITDDGVKARSTNVDRGQLEFNHKIYEFVSNPNLKSVNIQNMNFTDLKEDRDGCCQCCGDILINPNAFGLNIGNNNFIGACNLCVYRNEHISNICIQYHIHSINCGRALKDVCESIYNISYNRMTYIQNILNSSGWGALHINHNTIVINSKILLSCYDVSALNDAIQTGTDVAIAFL